MQHFIPLLSILAAPLLLPAASAGLRVLGLFLILIAAVWYGWRSYKTRSIPIPKSTAASIFFTTVMLLLLLTMFPDAWMYYSLSPSILSGYILCIFFLYCKPNILLSFGLISISSWVVLWLSSSNAQYIPSGYFSQHAQNLFSFIVNPPIQPVLNLPASYAHLQLQWMSYTSCFMLLMAAVLHPPAKNRLAYNIFLLLLLSIFVVFYVHLFGKFACFTMLLSMLCYFLLYVIPNQLFSFKQDWIWLIVTLILGAGSFGLLDSILLQISQLLLLLSFHPPTPITIPESFPVHSISDSTYLFGLQPADWLAIAVLAGVAASAVSYLKHVFTNGIQTALYASFALALLIMLPPSPLQWISHPVLWVCIGGMAFSPIHQHQTQEITANSRNSFPLDFRYTSMLCVLAVWGLFLLQSERRAENSLMKLMEVSASENRVAIAEQAHRDSFYRPDIRAIYVTWFIQNAVDRSIPPSEGKLLELELAAQSCSQYGFIPYLAIKRISDFYVLSGNTTRSIASVNELLALHPNDAKLHEIIAERQFEFGQYEQALEHFRICVNESPTAVRYHKKIALSLKSLGDDEAYKHTVDIIHTLSPLEDMK